MKKLIYDRDRISEYFKILEPDFPIWLEEYINTVALQKQKHISITCGTIYSTLFKSDFFYSSLDHSIAVALILWHFTHDKKQTIAGLLHDIATPVFKHCIDFLLGDAEKQEATEDLTSKFIIQSNDICRLLKRDGVNLSEVEDYHIYPIADNDTPKLSADRLEYSLSNALFTYKLADMDEIAKIYNDVCVLKNEDGIEELGFRSKDIATKFVELTTKLSIIYREDRTRYSMQFLADIVKRLNREKEISLFDLYRMKEKDVISLIRKSKYNKEFEIWENSKSVKVSNEIPNNKYYVHTKAKVRYINPLVNGERISDKSKAVKDMINKNLNYDMTNYVYLDFNFED